MPLKSFYVLARSGGGRPTLQHKMIDGQTEYTACGLLVEAWSRAFMPKAIEQVLCRRGACRA